MVTKDSMRTEEEGFVPESAKDIRDYLGLTFKELADICHCSQRTAARWGPEAKDHVEPRGKNAQMIRKLGQMVVLLDEITPQEEAKRWMRRPNRHFLGMAPIDLLAEHPEMIEDIINQLIGIAEGIPS